MFIKILWFVIADKRELLKRDTELAQKIGSNLRRHYELNHLAYKTPEMVRLDSAIRRVRTKLKAIAPLLLEESRQAIADIERMLDGR